MSFWLWGWLFEFVYYNNTEIVYWKIKTQKSRNMENKDPKDFMNFLQEDKPVMLRELLSKKVVLTYEGPDIPDGSMGPQDFWGEITSVSNTEFGFEFDKPDNWKPVVWGIEWIDSIIVLEWNSISIGKKTRLAVIANLFQYLWYVIFLFI